MAQVEPRIYEIADDLVDEFIEHGQCDYVDDFAKPFPVRAVMPVLGIPEDGWRDFAVNATAVGQKMNSDPDGQSRPE